MARTLVLQVATVLVLVLLIAPQVAQAVQLTEYTQEVSFTALGTNDEVQNNLDEDERTNYDTWDPAPSGVWFGGWSVESEHRYIGVPDTNFSMAMATVCRFGSDLVMSGAARTLVRLPMRTTASTWSTARLNIYQVDQGTNWTFSRVIAAESDSLGSEVDNMKINFTTGDHELIFWSPVIDPSDTSPTDGNSFFTRSNRTYAFVDAPLEPNVFYLFVTYMWFSSDQYVDYFVQPDSLDSDGEWNRSTLAFYNEEAPDTWSLDVHDFNLSMGYSFDFRHGFGNSCYGLNVWMDPGDEFEFYHYIDTDDIDGDHYMTFMLPYRSSTDNVTWDVSFMHYDPSDGSFTEFMAFSDYEANDFILLSMEQTWTTNVTGPPAQNPTGWIYIQCEVQNSTRIWLPLWNIPKAEPEARLNSTWRGHHVKQVWDSGDAINYNLQRFVNVERSTSEEYNYHWQVQHSLQFNDYYWQKNTPKTEGFEQLDPAENMTLTQKLFYGIGSVFIKVGDWIAPINYGLGESMRNLGTAIQLTAQYADIPDFVGWAYDRIRAIGDAFAAIGTWLWRVGQAVVGALRWFVETLAYYGSALLGLLIVALAFVVVFIPLFLSVKLGQIVVNLARGNWKGAVSDMRGLTDSLNPRR